VCEDLGGLQERVTQWTPESILGQTFSPLNVTILLRQHARPAAATATLPLIGLPEQSIAHRAGMITKREVRLLTLCALELCPGEVFWDVGAGSGSVALEAARLSPSLRVLAIERSVEAVAQIRHNVQAFALANVQPVCGEAPEAFAALPDPQAVFIGGSGGRLAAIIPAVTQRLPAGGRLVLNCITLEHLALGWELLRGQQLQVDATSVQLAHARPLGTLHRFEAESPIFILRAQKA
jgi:precorrin-6Y C5,15-methyltransferase (decarboxylating)